MKCGLKTSTGNIDEKDRLHTELTRCLQARRKIGFINNKYKVIFSHFSSNVKLFTEKSNPQRRKTHTILTVS